MRDTRMRTLARNLIHNSIKLQPGEKVLIEMHGHHPEMVNALLEAAKARSLGLLAVTHNPALAQRIATRTVEL